MIKSAMREARLAVQARTGLATSPLIWLVVAAFAGITGFAFLCVAAYVWLAQLVGGIFAGLIEAGFFLLVAAIAALAAAAARRRAKERAILERAARAQAGSWLLDPKILSTALELGRSLGWQRLIAVAMVAIVATQWARDHRERSDPESK